jgi:hypothetical protein
VNGSYTEAPSVGEVIVSVSPPDPAAAGVLFFPQAV